VSEPTLILFLIQVHAWGFFAYNYKVPCHLWQKETTAEKRVAGKDLAHRNQQIESQCKQDCYICAVQRVNLM
jgi:hypothetical protein